MGEKSHCRVNCSKDNLLFNDFFSSLIIHDLHLMIIISILEWSFEKIFWLSGEDNNPINFGHYSLRRGIKTFLKLL